MFKKIRSTTNTRDKLLARLAIVFLGACSPWLSGCAGLVSSSSKTAGNPTTLTITNASAVSATINSIQIDWTTNAPATSRVNYGKTVSYGSTTGIDSTMVSAHQAGIASLTSGTTYHFQISSTDGNGNSATSSDMTFTTLSNTTPPTVSIASPAAGATISGTAVILSATASDNVGVAGVQFKVDGTSVGSQVTTAPYMYALNTTTLSNANHNLTAVATDMAGNSATSAVVTVKVNNTVPDTTPPTVSMTAPANGATVSSTVAVSANASDNVAVASVQFQLDNANVGTPVLAAPYTYSWNTTKSNNGAHTLRAIATDTSNNSTTSASVTVTVNNGPTDTTPPTVSMTAPANGATVSNTVTVSANASDNVAVASVQFQLDNVNLGSADTVAPYTYSWDTTKSTNGSHTLRAIATDTSNNSTTSASVTVTVNNGPADTTPPSVPTGLTATAVSSSQINLSWQPSTDNVGVTGYNVYRGGSKIGTSTTTSYSDGGLTASTSYTYTVAAYDAAGNTSAQSAGASATTLAAGSGGSIPSTLGWYSIPNTAYQQVCPSTTTFASIQGASGCGAVVDAWGGGMADTSRNRLVFWGGGHHDYWGNEVYALDLNALTINRLDTPSSVSGLDFTNNTYESLGDGTPSARHTYGGLTYIPGSDLMYSYGGGLSGFGTLSNSTWTLSFSGLSTGSTGTCCWTNKSPSGGTPDAQFGELAEYDANTSTVFLWDSWQSNAGHLWQYTLSSNSYKLLGTFGTSGISFMDGYQSGAIDTSRKLFFAIGNGKLLQVSIAPGSSYTVTDMAGSASGCATAISGGYPGVAFDSISNNIVIWHGGNSAYMYNPSTNACTTATYTGGPTTVGQNGTYGRFRFFPALGVFAVCNEWTENCFTLRLDATSGGGTGGPAISSVGTTSVTSSGATIAWTTDVGSTSQVDYGLTTSYGTTTALNSTLVTSHSVALSGLAASTTYHFRVHSTNSGGTQSTSGDFSFATPAGVDTTPPTISMTAPANGATVTGTLAVSANATDNVGVASVQLLLDGSNLGSAITQAPYTMSWNSASASNGTHTLGATATDAAGNLGTAVPVTVTVSNSSTTPPGTVNGWTNRIAGVNVPGGAASIVSSQSFDTFPATNQQEYFKIYDPGGITTDCTNAADGCSLEFTMLPGYFQGEPGWFDYNFNSSLTALYGQGQEFYVQFKERLDPAMLQASTFTNFEGWKINILSEGDSPTAQAGNCSNTPADFVLISDNTTFPWIYENCGNDGSSLNFMSSAYDPIQLYGADLPSGGNYLDQPAAGCPHYAGRGIPSSDPTCWNFVGNEWFTVQEHIKIGTWGTASSTVDVWVAHQGQPSQLIVNTSDTAIADDGPSVTDKFGKIVFLPYATGATWNTTTHVWYDDLVISNRRLPDPEVSVPNAPDSLTASAGTHQVTLNWRVNSSNGTAQDDSGMLVERCTGNAPNCLVAPQSGFSQIASIAAHSTTYTDATPTSGTTYTYRVRATNASGNSAYAVAICFNNGTLCSTVTPN
jgi:chitodextrinase